MFNWSAASLARFADGSLEQKITFDNTGAATVRLQSTGRLGQLQTDSTLATLAIGGTVDGEQFYVSLLSKAYYTDLAAAYADSGLYQGADLPEVDLSYAPYNPGILMSGVRVKINVGQIYRKS